MLMLVFDGSKHRIMMVLNIFVFFCVLFLYSCVCFFNVSIQLAFEEQFAALFTKWRKDGIDLKDLDKAAQPLSLGIKCHKCHCHISFSFWCIDVLQLGWVKSHQLCRHGQQTQIALPMLLRRQLQDPEGLGSGGNMALICMLGLRKDGKQPRCCFNWLIKSLLQWHVDGMTPFWIRSIFTF